MSNVFLVNIGANSSHRACARCPRFEDGTFVYVPFPLRGDFGTLPYPNDAWPFTNGLTWYQTHADPDWENLTYGDYVLNGRAGALKRAQVGDTLMFWSLLWDNTGENWTTFTNNQSWHLIGSIRIQEILREGETLLDVSPGNRERAMSNAHFTSVRLEEGNIVFVGDVQRSRLFDYAVPFVKRTLTRSSLLYRVFRTSSGKHLPINGKHWSGYTRSCRLICDLDDADGYRRAQLLRDAIAAKNEFDLLAGL